MTSIVWPKALPPRNIAIDAVPRTLSGGAALNGMTQSVNADAGVWRIQYERVPVETPAKVRAWRALQSNVNGRANALLVSAFDARHMPVTTLSPTTTFSDGATFADGARFYQRSVIVTLAAAAALRATQLAVSVSAGVLEPGHHFSIGERLYRIAGVNGYTITIWPPLRAAANLGETLDFDDPVCVVRLATDSELDLTLQLGRTGEPSPSFVEDF